MIHPYADGNGRTGRAMANLILIANGYAPLLWLDNIASTEAISRAGREEKPDILQNYWRANLEAQQKCVRELRHFDHRMATCHGACETRFTEEYTKLRQCLDRTLHKYFL